jgi:hypothetical protein
MKFYTPLFVAVLVFLPVWAGSAPIEPQDPKASFPPVEITSQIVTIRMKDGSLLVARIVDQKDERLEIVTAGGVAMEIPRDKMDRHVDGDAEARPSDSNYTRLLFSPTGRPLAKGTGYFSDHYVVFPGVAYGLTDNLSISGGVSVIPGLGLGEQLFYVAPRFGKQFSDRVAVSAGVLWARGGEGEDEQLGVGFAMATFGQPDKSLTVGGGLARTVERYTEWQYVNGRERFQTFSDVSYTPVIGFGGTARLSRRVAFVSENWLVLHDDFKLSEQPFALGLRFLGDNLTADVGVILVGELIEEGFPVPWLSVSYHFGRKR